MPESSGRARLVLLAVVSLGLALGGTGAASPASADGPSTYMSSDGPIAVPNEAGVLLDNQPAVPYPSTMTVSGMAGPVLDVSLTLVGINHFFMRDIDVLLASPSGENLVVLSDAGGAEAQDLTLTLTDAATELVPHLTAPAATHLPTDIDLPPDDAEDVFAPGPTPSAYTSFAEAFRGTDPNGVWSLYIIDDSTAEFGTIQSWSLTITTASLDAGGPYVIDEGSPLTLAATTDLADAELTWDLDGDGAFDDATGPSPTIDEAALATLGLDDGPATATFAVTATADDLTVTDTAEVTVLNVAPTVTVMAPATVSLNEPFTVTITVDDPSASDREAGFSALVDVYADLQATCEPPFDPANPPPDVIDPLALDIEASTTELEFSLTSGDPYAVWVAATDVDGAATADCAPFLALEDPVPTTPPDDGAAAPADGAGAPRPPASAGGDELAATGSSDPLLGAAALLLIAGGLLLRRLAAAGHRGVPSRR